MREEQALESFRICAARELGCDSCPRDGQCGKEEMALDALTMIRNRDIEIASLRETMGEKQRYWENENVLVREELVETRMKLIEARETICGMREAQVVGIEKRGQAYRDEIARLKKRIDRADKDGEDLRGEIARLERELERAQKLDADLRRENAELWYRLNAKEDDGEPDCSNMPGI